MLAQRQPPFEECVTAHWTSDAAPKMIGTEEGSRSCGCALRMVGERPMRAEAVAEAMVDCMGAIMQT